MRWKPFGQDVQQEAADELGRRERHGRVAAWSLDPVVLDPEGHARSVGGDQAAVGDGDAVGVARQVGEHGLRPGEGALGVDEPAHPLQRGQERGERIGVGEVGMRAEEVELAGFVRGSELLQHQAPEQLGEHQHGQEEVGLGGDPALAIRRECRRPARSCAHADGASWPSPRCAAPR